MGETQRTLALTAGAEDEGRRLDHVLARLVPEVSRTRLQTWIKDGRVSVAGRRVQRPGALVAARAPIEVVPPAPADFTMGRAASSLLAADLPVLFADEHMIAVDKPAGMLSHPAARVATGTVADIAEARFGPLPRIQGEDRPGIVHRLDRGTSGVMVLGRTSAALEDLKDQFRRRTVLKTYLALVHGAPRFDSEWIDAPIARPAARRDRLEVARDGAGRPASTYFEVRERFDGFALLACFPKTGRTHQVRVHLTSFGHALVGDRVYRRRGGLAVSVPADAPRLERQALHAQALEVRHPASGEPLRLEAPLAPDIAALLDWLRARRE